MQEAVASALTSVLASSVYRKHALAAAAPLAACLAHAAPLFRESLNPAESLCKEPGGVGGGRVGEGGEGGGGAFREGCGGEGGGDVCKRARCSL